MRGKQRFFAVSGLMALAIIAGLVMFSHAWRAPVDADTVDAKHQRTIATLTDLENAFETIADETRPSVVSIQVEKRVAAPAMQMPFDDQFFSPFFGGRRQFGAPRGSMRERGAGSGVVVDAKGYVLTNNHVVDGADNISVILNDAKHTQLKATVVGTDPRSDLAVLKVTSATPLHAAKLGDSNEVKVGQWAVAIGNQLGEFDASLTVGVVSATGRRLDDMGEDADYRDLIQTDAAINRGNSGGPLVNVHGEVIGINSAIATPNSGSVGLGFAIPSNTAKHVMEELIAHGRVERGFLGVSISSLDDTLKKFYKAEGGALVQSVQDDGPAAKAGIKAEDVITSLNGQAVEDADALRNAIGNLAPRSEATIGLVRDGKPMTLTVKLGDLPSDTAHASKSSPDRQSRDDQPRLGVGLTPLTDDVRAQLKAPASLRGVAIESVAPGSPAQSAGLQPGDVIERVNRTPVASIDDVRAALGKQETVVLKVWRGGESRVVAISLHDDQQ